MPIISHEIDINPAVVIANLKCRVERVTLIIPANKKFIAEVGRDGLYLPKIIGCSAIIAPTWQIAITLSCHISTSVTYL